MKAKETGGMPALVVGLTGGIGSGKSAVTGVLEALGVPVIDADVIARELVRPGSEALAQIVAAFGDEILSKQGELDRRALRQRIFGDDDARHTLEAILHPKIRRTIAERLAAVRYPYAVLAVPLLLESKDAYKMVNRVAVVDVPKEQQISRTVARDSTTPQAVERIIAAQMERTERLALADDVIDNSGDLAQMRSAVQDLHERYLKLAGTVAEPAP